MTLTNRRLCTLVPAALALLATTGVAFGHHSTAMFDMRHPIKITGVVARFDWTNPHTFIWLDTGNGPATKVEYSIEGMSPNYLSRNGWNHNTLKVGDHVTLEIFPLKDGRKGGFCNTVTFADGRVIHNLPGRPTEGVRPPPGAGTPGY